MTASPSSSSGALGRSPAQGEHSRALTAMLAEHILAVGPAEHTTLLAGHAAAGRVSSAAEIPRSIHIGCIFSNELLDALPVHRVAMERGVLREIYVGYEAARFIDVIGNPSMPALQRY